MFYLNFFAFFAFVSKLLRAIVNPILTFVNRKYSGHIPEHGNSLLDMNIAELTMKIKTQEIKCVDIIKAYIERTKQVNPFINAVVANRFNEAIYEANEIDLLCASGDISLERYPLLGVPFSVKQVIGLKDMPKHYGCVYRTHIKFDRDAETVTLLREAGAIPIMSGNTPELTIGYESKNKVVGRTNNPRDFTKTPGGSSGGDAALIATNCCVFAVGTDYAGSIRLPSLFCGIYGHKPTPGIVSRDKIFPRFTRPVTATVGALAHNLSDLELVLKVMAGSKADQINLQSHQINSINLRDLKVFYLDSLALRWFMSEPQIEIKQAINNIAKYLKTKVSRVTPFNAKEFYYLPEVVNTKINHLNNLPHFLVENAKNEDDLEEGNGTEYANTFLEFVKYIFGFSKYSYQILLYQTMLHSNLIAWSGAERFINEAERLESFLIDLLSNNSVLIMPTYPKTAITHSGTYLYGVESTYLALANGFKLPAMHIPTGYDKNNLPVGIQIIAGPYMDHLCFVIAREVASYVKSLSIKNMTIVDEV